jgi:tetraacyldisaccharide 4'-kinase
MRASIENRLLHHWYGNHKPPWYLRILEPVYRSAFLRSQKHGKTGAGVYKPELPLIVVGNITAGGSGKTPLVIRLCQLATEMNLKPGIASTGYGRQSQETFVVQAESDTRICGDEPVLLAQRTRAAVVVAARRTDAVKELQKLNVDLLISDDGLQQADLYRDVDICVVDGFRGLGNGHLIPAGPLRESAERLERVDHIVTNGPWGNKPSALNAHVMRLEASLVCALDGNTELPIDEFRQQHDTAQLHAIAAIGRPQRFFTMLENNGLRIIPHPFPDHHVFTPADFEEMKGAAAILMTEKDAVKCRDFGLQNAWYVPVETCLSTEFETILKNQMVNLIKDRK